MRLSATKILLLIILFALAIRVLGLFQVAAYDEHCWLGWNECPIWHPPLSQLSHLLFREIFGSFDWVGRSFIVLIGITNLVLVYLLSKKLYNKKAALFAAALMAFGAYPLLASLQLDIDGSFLLLFYLLTTLFFVEYEQTKRSLWLVLAGLAFGLSLLSKYSGIFILPILGLYHILKNRNILWSVKTFIPLALIGLVVFSFFPLISILTHSILFQESITHLQGYAGSAAINIPLLLIQYLLSLIWMGPLLIGLLALSLIRPRKQDLLSWIWITLIFVVYTLLNKDNFRPLERYFIILVAPLSMIGGNYLSRLNLNKKHLIVLSALTLISLSTLLALNLKGDLLPFYPKEAFINRALSLDWNFYLPITGSSGPIGFFLNFGAIAFCFISSVACISLSFIFWSRKRAISAWLIVIFLAISLSSNLFVVQEFLLSSTSPNINKISRQLIDYSLSHELNQPVFVFRNYAFRYYLREKYGDITPIDFELENDEQKVDELVKARGTVIVVDFPKINEKSIFWQKIQTCKLVKNFEDKKLKLGYIFDCAQI